ncbi:MAG: BrnT family toxin [Blastocatellia bacterium]
MSFEWHPPKAESNLEKHGVLFEEAATAFDDDLQVILQDTWHSMGERRYRCIGRSQQGRLLLVVYTERPGDVIRIISAREATPNEEEMYEQENYLT